MLTTRQNTKFSAEEHAKIARHIYAIEGHVRAILHIGRGRLRAKWQDELIRYLNQRALGKIRSALDDDCAAQKMESPYYGSEAAVGTCGMALGKDTDDGK